MAMPTRSELRAKKRTPDEPAVVTTPEKKPINHHIKFRVWGAVFLTILALMLLVETTLLNKNFVKHEIENSSLESVMLAQVNSTLTSYGIPTSVLEKSDTDKIINQAVDQVYSGKKINLDMSPVVNSVDSSINGELAQFGIATSMLPAGSTSMVTENINAAVNKQLNTPVVTKIISGIQVAKVVVNIVLIANLILLVLMIGKSFWQQHLIASFSWISVGAVALLTIIVSVIKAIAGQVGAQFPEISPFIFQVVEDFQQRGMMYAFLLVGVAVILFGIRIVKWIWQPNH